MAIAFISITCAISILLGGVLIFAVAGTIHTMRALNEKLKGHDRAIAQLLGTPRAQIYEIPNNLIEELKKEVLRDIYKGVN